MFLLEYIFELCFSLSHGKKIFSGKCSKICSATDTAMPLGDVSSDVIVGKQGEGESQQKEKQQNNFLKVFYLVRGH